MHLDTIAVSFSKVCSCLCDCTSSCVLDVGFMGSRQASDTLTLTTAVLISGDVCMSMYEA